MPNNKWDDDHIESLLRDFPAIKDERPKEEVYERLKNSHTPKKKQKHWIPVLVAALAFITFGVLLASTLGQNNSDSASDMSGAESSGESADSHVTAVDEEKAESESAAKDASDTAEEAENFEASSAPQEVGAIGASSVYAEDLEGSTLFTLGVTENALVIPASFLISDAQLEEDFGRTDVDAVDLYNYYAAELDEEALGFDDYHPYSGTIAMTDEGIEHTLPDGHNYDMASAAMSVYFNSLSVSFGEIPQILIVDESGNPADFDQVGPLESMDPALKDIAYYSYPAANGNTYLTPGFNMPHESADEALNAMKSSSSDFYFSVIPAEVDYTVSESDDIVTVEFNESIDFDSYDYQEAVRMIEAMALAADSFGKELVMENTAAESWDRFNFTEPLPVPIGLNLMEFTD